MNRQATKISVVSSCKIDKYGYFTDDKILPANHQSQIIEQAKFTYYSLAKDLEKQARTIGDEAKKLTKKQLKIEQRKILNTDQKSISNLFSKDFLTEEA